MAIDKLERPELERPEEPAATFVAGPRLPSPDLPEIGAPGTRIFGGFISTEEYVPELEGRRGLDVFERMRRSDGMVAAALRGIKLPLLSAEWDVVAASEDPRDIAIADFVKENLFGRIAWQEHLREVLTFLDFGFSVFEKVWEIADVAGETRVVLKKLAPRMQRTIWRWIQGPSGDVETVQQQKWLNGAFSIVDIPMAKLLVFTNEKEGANYLGRSILRPSYKHWFIKDQLYRIQAIAAERHGVGIPVMSLPADKSDPTNMQRAEDILAGVRANERGYIVELFGYKFRVEGTGSSAVMDLDPMIKHHDFMISVSVLAQFLTLGSQEQGARALAQDLTALFLMTEEALGAYAADVHNRYLIPELVNYNFAGVTAYPKLAVSSIESRNVVALLAALAQAATAGLVTGDLSMQNLIRKWIGATPLDSVAVRQAPDPNDPGTETESTPEPAGALDVGEGGDEG